MRGSTDIPPFSVKSRADEGVVVQGALSVFHVDIVSGPELGALPFFRLDHLSRRREPVFHARFAARDHCEELPLLHARVEVVLLEVHPAVLQRREPVSGGELNLELYRAVLAVHRRLSPRDDDPVDFPLVPLRLGDGLGDGGLVQGD